MDDNKSSYKPVFYDGKQIRWKVFITLLVLATIFFASVAFTLVNLIFQVVPLPALPLETNNIELKPSGSVGKISSVQKSAYLLSLQRLNDFLAHVPKKSIIQTQTPLKKFGFYVNWDSASYTSLKRNISNLDYLIPEWVALNGPDGSTIISDPNQQNLVVNFVKQNNPNLKIIPLVNNFDNENQNFNSTWVADTLQNEATRQNFINNIYDYVTSNKFSGINVDLENIPTSSIGNFNIFERELYDKFHKAGLIVILDLPASDSDYNYKYLGSYSDYVIPMMYDYHWQTSTSGPLSPQGWYLSSLSAIENVIPPQKLVLGLGNYGYDWNISSNAPAEDLSFEQLIQRARTSNTQIYIDPSSLNPYFTYVDANKNKHIVWFLDAATAYNQILAATKIHPYGISIWRLGSEDSNIWNVINNISDLKNPVGMLSTVTNDLSVDYFGQGQVLKVISTPASGLRIITVDKFTNYITNEKYTLYPTSYGIQRLGNNNNKVVALTFDDGPDPQYTQKILDILKQNNINATFFIIGAQGDLYPNLLKEMYSNGNEIGNHTFTHPNISQISQEQLMLEVNATQRLIESATGQSTTLFRSPYNEDAEPTTPEQANPLVEVSNLGYYSIGIDVDPHDWAKPGADSISQDAIDGVNSGGKVILLHDGGGDRSQTIEALPTIISTLKSEGYQFVTISDLIGVNKSDVMPAATYSTEMNYILSEIGFLSVGSLFDTIRIIFWVGTILGLLRLTLIITLAFAEKFKKSRQTYAVSYLPKVSVLIPAWNEEKVIVKTVENLLKSDYPDFEIIVIDDGSRDSTYTLVKNTFQNNPKVKVLTKSNGGKSTALNLGVANSNGQIIVAQDADTLLDQNAISKLVRHFGNTRIGAVAGNVKVGNRLNIVTKFQALEYIISQNLDRRAYDVLNAISVVPGAIGAWRKELIKKAGGFHSDTLAEDAELTLRILEIGYKVEYDETAIAYTEAPENLKVFLLQRFRWMFGTLQATWKHKYVLLKYKYGSLGLFTIPNILLFQILFPLISPLLDIFTIIFLSVSIWQTSLHQDISIDGIREVVIFYTLFSLLDIVTSLIAFTLERKEDIKLIILLPFQRLIYRYLIYWIAVKSFLTAVKGPKVAWETKKRMADVASADLP